MFSLFSSCFLICFRLVLNRVSLVFFSARTCFTLCFAFVFILFSSCFPRVFTSILRWICFMFSTNFCSFYSFSSLFSACFLICVRLVFKRFPLGSQPVALCFSLVFRVFPRVCSVFRMFSLFVRLFSSCSNFCFLMVFPECFLCSSVCFPHVLTFVF